jgi:hypothetical protein
MYQHTKIIDKKFTLVGSFNAGIIGYFCKKAVIVNLDGLINDNVVYYLTNNQMCNYLIKNKLFYIVDFKISNPTLYGFSNNELQRFKIIDSIYAFNSFKYQNLLRNTENHYIYEFK